MNGILLNLLFKVTMVVMVVGLPVIGAALTQQKTTPDAVWVGADDQRLQYNGRVGFEDPKEATFYYAASGFRTRFSGRSLALRLEEDRYGPANSFGVRIDRGIEIPIRLTAGADHSYVVAVGLPNRVHDLEVYRRQDTYGGVTKFKGLWIDKGAKLLAPPARSSRKIEFFGDSVTAGAATMAFGYEAKPDGAIDYDNADEFMNNGYWGLGASTARLLKADANIEGIGGLALLDHTGWFGGELEHTIGLETTYDKLNPIPGQLSPWDFSRFTPNVVVIAVGQNDARGGDMMDPLKREQWKATYTRVLNSLRGHYPYATFVLTTTILMHDRAWDKAIQEVVIEFNRERNTDCIRYFEFKRSGNGTPGHPRLVEQEEMARELASYLDHLPGAWNHKR